MMKRPCDMDIAKITPIADLMPPVLLEIANEQQRAFSKYGGPSYDDGRATSDWERYIVRFATTSGEDFRSRMVKIAGLAISAIESYDRNTEPLSG